MIAETNTRFSRELRAKRHRGGGLKNGLNRTFAKKKNLVSALHVGLQGDPG